MSTALLILGFVVLCVGLRDRDTAWVTIGCGIEAMSGLV
jgi:hypothetical protein